MGPAGVFLVAQCRPSASQNLNRGFESRAALPHRPFGGLYFSNVQYLRTIPRSQISDGPTEEVTLDLHPTNGDESDPVLPKFQPFVAHNELRRRMLTYYREYPTPDGQLLIVQPVSAEWTDEAAELLTEAFADAMGYVTIYRNFLRRQIRNYLRLHMDLPPKTVCLVALLVNPEVASSNELEQSSNNNSGVGEQIETSSSVESSNAVSSPPTEDMLDDFESSFEARLGDGMGIAYPSSSEEESGEESESSAYGGVDRAVRRQYTPSTARLVATVEISFTESTRSKDMAGLNPPPERPYMCNMAVAKDARRRGIGGLLLGAAEDLVRRVGDNCIYLHLRFKDAPAAAMYKKAGYVESDRDAFWVKLFGQDRRWLMRKDLGKLKIEAAEEYR